MTDIGAIHKSTSPWASAIVLVHKKDSGLWFCIDLRTLNNKMIKDAQSLPRIEDSLECLEGATIFTSPDLHSGHWQVELTEVSKPLTAFTVGLLGFYKSFQMSSGLTTTPATFQCLMEAGLGDMHPKWCFLHLDNVIILSETPEEHIHRLSSVFEKLSATGLQLKPTKCEFLKSCITYMEYMVSKDSIGIDPKKTTAIKEWPVPKQRQKCKAS